MKKKLLIRCLIGAPVGVAVSTMITIIISMTLNDGKYYAVVPELVRDCGSELNAVILQAICSLIYGAAGAGASVIWEMENWSILRQTFTHLIICSLVTFPIAYFMRWMNHSLSGVLIYFSIFFGIYLIIWLSQYSSMKKRVDQINRKIQEKSFDSQ